MGLSSSSKKTTQSSTSTTAPSALTSPYVTQGLQDSQAVLNANQGTLQGLSSSALAGYNAIAPQSYSASPYVTAAQAANQSIASGANLNTSPGASTLNGLMQPTVNPASSTLSSVAAGGVNPASASLSTIANNNSPNAATTALGAQLNAGTSGTLGQIAQTGTNGQTNGAANYDQSVLDGAYLNNNPYIDAITQQATDAATKAANQRFGAAGLGAGLSSAYTSALGSAVADANNTTRAAEYNTERAAQDAASARISSNYNAAQDRSATAAQQGVTDNLSAATALGSQLNNQAGQQISAASTLGSLYNQGQANQTSAASALGSLYNQGQQTQLSAANDANSSYQTLLAQQIAAINGTSDLNAAQYAGIAPTLQLASAAASLPYTGVDAYAGLLGTLANPYTTTNSSGTSTTKESPSLASSLGSAFQIAALPGVGSAFNSLGGALGNALIPGF